MPHTTFGFGTGFIGKRDFASNRYLSYVTTEFVVALIPLYPLRSLRVIEGQTTTEYNVLMHTSTNYTILAEGKRHWKQCVYVYAFTVLYLTYAGALVAYAPSWLTKHTAIWNPLWLAQFGMFILPLIVPFTMRMIARRHPSDRWHCPCGSGKPYRVCCQTATEERREANRNPHKTFT